LPFLPPGTITDLSERPDTVAFESGATATPKAHDSSSLETNWKWP